MCTSPFLLVVVYRWTFIQLSAPAFSDNPQGPQCDCPDFQFPAPPLFDTTHARPSSSSALSRLPSRKKRCYATQKTRRPTTGSAKSPVRNSLGPSDCPLPQQSRELWNAQAKKYRLILGPKPQHFCHLHSLLKQQPTTATCRINIITARAILYLTWAT